MMAVMIGRFLFHPLVMCHNGRHTTGGDSMPCTLHASMKPLEVHIGCTDRVD